MPLLLHGREMTADAARSGGHRGARKGVRNLLLHFGHAQIPLSQIVGKGEREVIESRVSPMKESTT